LEVAEDAAGLPGDLRELVRAEKEERRDPDDGYING
jgi:hypothetical protein